ncbi:MAG: hypothetical protein LBG44_03795 [Gemmatimonadota bacterium]|jgi:DNA repair exonuclease SbcCD ATPase subunit|nr:hypothetical protein [Gemmatimonadota bacterium]
MGTHVSDQQRSSEAAREEIERTRARMSDTIEEIEAHLLRKKEEIRDRLDIASRIREDPIRAAAIAIGAGVLVGFLTGGGGRAKRRFKQEKELRRREEESAELWERRARKLLAIGRKQQTRIEKLESTTEKLSRRIERRENRIERRANVHARLTELRSGAVERIEDAAASAAKRFRKSILRNR